MLGSTTVDVSMSRIGEGAAVARRGDAGADDGRGAVGHIGDPVVDEDGKAGVSLVQIGTLLRG